MAKEQIDFMSQHGQIIRKLHFPDTRGEVAQRNLVFVIACTRPMQAQTRRYCSIEEGSSHEISPIVEELLVIDICQDREREFSLRACPPDK